MTDVRIPPFAAHLPRALLIAIAPFLFLLIVIGVLDLYRADRPAESYRFDEQSLRIRSVTAGGAAERAGLQRGDAIRSIDNTPIGSIRDMHAATSNLRVGDTVSIGIVRGDQPLVISFTIERLDREARLHKSSLAAIALSFLALGLVVVLRRADTLAIVFYSLSLVLSFVIAPVPTYDALAWNLFVNALYRASFALLPTLFLHFFLIFPFRRQIIRRVPRFIPSMYVLSIVLFGVTVTLDVVFHLKGRDDLIPAIVLFSTANSFLIVAGLVAGIVSFVIAYLSSPSGNVRRRLKIVLWGTILGFLPLLVGTITKSLFPSIVPPGSRYYHLSLFLVPLSYAYAIIRYGLMDLEIIVKRGVIYAVLTGLLAAVYLLLVEGIGRLAMIHSSGGSLILKLVSIFFMALIFSPVRTKLQEVVDRMFYRDRLNYRETLRDVGEEIAGIIELEPLVGLFAQRIRDSLRVTGVSIYLRNKSSGRFPLAAHAGDASGSAACYVWNSTDETLAWVCERRRPLPIERLQESVRWNRLPRGEKQALRDLDAALLIPLLAGGQPLGLIIVGSKISQELHSNEDLSLLQTVTAHATLAIENALLHKESIERARLEGELHVARRIQESFLPTAPPAIPGVELSALNVPCLEVGGDYYDYIMLDESRLLGLAIGDASGKGIPAAILMASFQAAFHLQAEAHLSPARVLERMNKLIVHQTRSERFVTFFYGVLDVESRVLTYSNAGHNPPLLIRADGTALALDNAGLLLGVSPETSYEDVRVVLESGDLLLLYTDGVTDELNPSDDIFGMERLEKTLWASTELPLPTILNRVYSSVAEFMGGAPEDDITLLGVKVL
ncbi:MAG: SpoIIE family protein phosphatase [bacterium]